MLAFMRRVFIGSWLGRILVGLIFLSFAALGVGNFFTGMSHVGGTNVARVAGRDITADDFQHTYQRGLASAAQSQGLSDPTALPFAARRQIAIASLQQLVFQAVIADKAHRIGIVVPDQLVRDQIFSQKGFAGPDGSFDRTVFNQRLQQAGFTEDQLVRLVREQSAATALIEPIRVGAHAPAELVRRAFDFAVETRTIDMIALPFSSVAAPAAPDDATLHRYYVNNAAMFTAPEYRKIKLVLLSPETIGHGIDVSETDERAAYKEMITRYQVAERRSMQLLILPSQARAEQVAALWRGGVVWSQLQATAKDATSISLDDVSAAGIPSPDIARLVFGAVPDSVVGPARADAGWVVLRVSKVTPAVSRSFDQARDEIHDAIGRQRAAGLLSPRVEKLQDAIAGGGLDAIPADLGAVAAEGTLDAQGLTQTGDPAPLPGDDAVRRAILAQAFQVRHGDVPILMQGPENSWYALQVEAVTPSRPLPYAQAADRARAAWTRDAIRHADEQAAAALYADARTHGGIATVAAGRPGLQRDVVVHRGQAGGAVPQNLAQIAFSLKPGNSTMLETPDGFVVATITGVNHPSRQADAPGYSRASQALDASLADDIENSYVSALRDRAGPSINGHAVEQVVGQPGAGDASSGS